MCPVSPVHRPSTHSTHAPPHCAQVFEYPDKVGYMPADEVRYVLENLNEDLSGLEIEFMMNLVQQQQTAGNAHKQCLPCSQALCIDVCPVRCPQADPYKSGMVSLETLIQMVTPPYEFDHDAFPDPRHPSVAPQ